MYKFDIINCLINLLICLKLFRLMWDPIFSMQIFVFMQQFSFGINIQELLCSSLVSCSVKCLKLGNLVR